MRELILAILYEFTEGPNEQRILQRSNQLVIRRKSALRAESSE